MELYRGIENLKKVRLERLNKIHKAEKTLIDMGFKYFKIRYSGNVAIIEVEQYERVCFFDLNIMDKVGKELRKIGFKYVTLNLIGSSTGCTTEV